MLTRALVAARTRLVRITTELSNQIRGLMKTFGLLVPAGKGSTFERNVRNLLVDQDGLLSCCRGWKPGATCAFGPRNSGVSLSLVRVKAERSPVSAQSPRLRS
ncbi:hypothetical protein BAE40_12915 [Mesorhizobium loti]|nr:hypothetical protein BAE40_12915 [Mesorhizobium loti]